MSLKGLELLSFQKAISERASVQGRYGDATLAEGSRDGFIASLALGLKPVGCLRAIFAH